MTIANVDDWMLRLTILSILCTCPFVSVYSCSRRSMFIFFIMLLPRVLGYPYEEQCAWAAKLDSISSATEEVKNKNFIKIGLDCGSKEASKKEMLEGLLTGLAPGVRVLCYNQANERPPLLKTLEVFLSTGIKMIDNCLEEYCPDGWFAPFPHINGTVVYGVEVISNGLGREIPHKMFAFNMDGYLQYSSRTNFGAVVPRLESMLAKGNPSRPLYAVVGYSPVLVLAGIPGHSAILITTTEFQTSTLIRVSISETSSESCSTVSDPFMITEAIATESSLFILKGHQLFRFFGNYPTLLLPVPSSGSWERLLNDICISRIIPVYVTHHGREFFYVVGGDDNDGTLYKGKIRDGVLTFFELVDKNNETVCDFVLPEVSSCQVLWAALDTERSLDYILVKLFPASNKLVYKVLTLENQTFREVGTLPEFVPSGPLFAQVDTNIPLAIRGMVFSPISQVLYIWGNVLLFTINIIAFEEFDFYKGFPSDMSIKYFTLSTHGEFTLVTDNDEIWWGVEEMHSLIRLRPSIGWEVFAARQKLRNQKSYFEEPSLITVFYDVNKQLFELNFYVDSTGKGSVRKRKLPVAEIIYYTDAGAWRYSKKPRDCPFTQISFKNLIVPKLYNQKQWYQAPTPVTPTGMQTVKSFKSYYYLVQQFLQLHFTYTDELKSPDQHPTKQWGKDRADEAYYFYLASNAVPQEDFIEVDAFSETYGLRADSKIYLDRLANFSFTVLIKIFSRSEDKVEPPPFMSVHVSNPVYIQVETVTKRARDLANYRVTVKDKGALPSQRLPGDKLMHLSIMLWVSDSGKCYVDGSQGMIFQGQHRLPIYIGCPPGLRLVFDIMGTLAVIKENSSNYFDCSNPEPGNPCFRYKLGFPPIFLIEDMLTGKTYRYNDSYTLKVIAGGPFFRENIVNYTDEEILQYNSVYESGNIDQNQFWRYAYEDVKLTKEGFIVMNGTANLLIWQCLTDSPCHDLEPRHDRDFYFVMEFSNRNINASTYCDYTIRFVIHVHGFPLNKIKQLLYKLISMIVSLFLVFIYVFIRFILHNKRIKKGKGATSESGGSGEQEAEGPAHATTVHENEEQESRKKAHVPHK